MNNKQTDNINSSNDGWNIITMSVPESDLDDPDKFDDFVRLMESFSDR